MGSNWVCRFFFRTWYRNVPKISQSFFRSKGTNHFQALLGCLWQVSCTRAHNNAIQRIPPTSLGQIRVVAGLIQSKWDSLAYTSRTGWWMAPVRIVCCILRDALHRFVCFLTINTHKTQISVLDPVFADGLDAWISQEHAKSLAAGEPLTQPPGGVSTGSSRRTGRGFKSHPNCCRRSEIEHHSEFRTARLKQMRLPSTMPNLQISFFLKQNCGS